MQKRPHNDRVRVRGPFAALALWLLAFAAPALAGPPVHLHNAAIDLVGAAPDPGPTHPAQPFNHACGTAVDSKGDVYVASAGNGVIDVFNPAHEYLTSIPDTHEPCGLAVNSKGELFVIEKALGKVVRYKSNAYPFSGTPTYGSAEAVDSSGNAKGISVDRFDNSLYVAEGNRIAMYNSEGTPGINEVQRVFTEGATGGFYKLKFKGEETAKIAWNAPNTDPGTPGVIDSIQEALEALTAIGAGNVAVAQGVNANDHVVTFKGALGGTDVELLQANTSELTGSLTIELKVNGFNGHIGEGSFTNATGVAAYTYKVDSGNADRYVFAADAAATDQVKAFGGADIRSLKLRRTIKGPKAGEDFGFAAAGAYLAVDSGNRSAEDKCASIAEQACTAGHLLVYDNAHNAVDEFDATGEFLDQFTNAAFADAQPTALAVDRSGGPNDGTIYVTAAPGPGAKLLAFGPLAAPSRAALPELSKVLAGAQSVATDSHGDVYVAAGPLIHVYDPTGKEIKVGPEGKGIEDLEVPLNDLAIDSTGKVYVLEVPHQVGKTDGVTYYTPSAYPPVDGTTYARHAPPIATEDDFPSQGGIRAIAVNPGPSSGKDHVFVSSLSSTREYDSAAKGSGFLRCFACGLSGLPGRESIGVNGANGNVYFGTSGGGVYIVDPTGQEILAHITGAGGPGGPLSGNPRVAVDQSTGHVLLFGIDLGAAREYDASGGFVAEFGQFAKLGSIRSKIAFDNACALHDPPLTEATTPTCKEFDPSGGNVYVAFDEPGNLTNHFDLTAFAPLAYGEAPLAETGIAGNVGAGNATLNGTVNPRGFELTECKFEYLTDAQYISNGKTFAGATPKACAGTLAAIGKGKSPVAVHADITGVDPETTRYRFRLIAKNKYGESEGKAWLFGPPVLTTKSALPVLYDEATLRAEVDPSGLATEYRFEYGTEEDEYDQSTPVVKLAPGDGKVPIQAPLTGLAEGTEYHFRIVVENEAQTVEGSDQTLVTLERRPPEACPNVEYRTGLSANLPDCRAYELVTPAETNGLSPAAAGSGNPGTLFNNWLVTPRGAGAGERLSYFTPGTLPGFDGNGRFDGYRAQRGEGPHPKAGWRSELFGPSFEESAPGILNLAKQQGVSSDQLYSFWLMEPEETFPGTLPEGIYLRVPGGTANPECTPAPHAQLDFEVAGCGDLGTDLKTTSQFVSAGGAHVIFSSKEHLEAKTAPIGTEAIYDRAAGVSTATVISLKPGGTPFDANENAAYVASTEDGSAVVFKVGGALYLSREGQSAEVAEGTNTFAGVAEDGKRVFYAAGTDMDSSGNLKPASLFVCDVEAGPCAGTGAHAPTQIATNAIFIDVSPDGSHAFFSSEEAIPGVEPNENGEVAEANERNLYAWEAQTETTRFIAQLDPQDFVKFAGSNPAFSDMRLGSWTMAINAGTHIGRAQSPTRSTPDGEVFVFQSHARLTPYDNGGHGEIYRYDPAAKPGERLTCPSCDPSGAPPSADAVLQDATSNETVVINETLIPNVTDAGSKVFFQSPDRLLPEDANSVVDVYEWQAKDTPNCKRPGGCLALISSGQGERNNFLYGMSANGRDVFFSTLEKLVGADVPGSPSIYDAREEGGIPDPPAKAPCQGDACQGSGSTPPALAVPASSGSGDGNAPPEPPARCAKGKHRVKGRCVKTHRKRKHHRRAGHNRRAAR